MPDEVTDAEVERALEMLGNVVETRLSDIGKAAFAWRSFDADLAELLAETPVAVRSVATDSLYRFVGSEVTVTVTVGESPAGVTSVDVVVDGPEPDAVTLYGPAGLLEENDHVEYGTASFMNLDGRFVRVGIRRADRTVMTPWIAI